MKVSRQFFTVFTAGAILTLAGCGGGGGGGNNTADSPDVKTSSYDVRLPKGVTTKDVDGDVDGKMVVAGSDATATSVVMGGSMVPRSVTGVVTGATVTSRDVAGFVAERPAPVAGGVPAASASDTLDLAALELNNAVGSNGPHTGIVPTGVQEISRQGLAQGSVELARFELTTSSNAKPTQVAGELLALWGLNQIGGTLSNLPAPLADESSSTTFNIQVGVLYADANSVYLAVTVVTSGLAGTYEALTDVTTNPNNAVASGTRLTDQTDTYAGTDGGDKADFLFVVDNSGSMSNEQTNLENAASTFSSTLNSSGLDFQLGIVTTDSSTLQGGGFTADTQQFQNDVNGLGTGGAGSESGIYHAEEALDTGGSVDMEGFPRSESQLSVVMLSDEPDQYSSYSSGTTFDVSSNIFIDEEYIVHAIVDTDSSSIDFGETYIDLANNTGGSRAPINTPDGSDLTESDFTQIMTSIAQKAGGAASAFKLTQTPVPSTISVTNGGSSVPQSSTDGWTYNSSANSIVFNGNAIPGNGDQIQVSYRYSQ